MTTKYIESVKGKLYDADATALSDIVIESSENYAECTINCVGQRGTISERRSVT